MIRRIAVALLVAGTVLAKPAGAQIGRIPRGGYGDPGYWVGVSYGYVSGTTIADDATSSVWQFGYTSQLRASIEKTVQSGFSIGASAAFETAPLTYSSNTFTAACAGSCAANANISQYMAFIRGGSGPGFHVVYTLEAGMTEFSKFRTKDGDASLAPTTAKYDFSFGVGGGFGYGFSRTSEVYAGQQWDMVMHPQGTAAGTNTNAPRMSTFRAGFRIGF
ncbi:MAG: hypothetical protein ACREPM_03950 [Gemmatimonadaceae bacterium]